MTDNHSQVSGSNKALNNIIVGSTCHVDGIGVVKILDITNNYIEFFEENGCETRISLKEFNGLVSSGTIDLVSLEDVQKLSAVTFSADSTKMQTENTDAEVETLHQFSAEDTSSHSQKPLIRQTTRTRSTRGLRLIPLRRSEKSLSI